MAALTQGEAAVYDRQIRVWGVETQQRYTHIAVVPVSCGRCAASDVCCDRDNVTATQAQVLRCCFRVYCFARNVAGYLGQPS